MVSLGLNFPDFCISVKKPGRLKTPYQNESITESSDSNINSKISSCSNQSILLVAPT